MAFLSALDVVGDTINLTRTHPGHLRGLGDTAEPGSGGDFGNLLMKALNGVNDMQQESQSLATRMITEPDSVDPHDVTIAMAKANLSVSMTKAVVDRALQAYTNIINLR